MRSSCREKITAVIVNYKTASLTGQCLQSLTNHHGNGTRLAAVVVDNASGDGSAGEILEAVRNRDWGAWVKVLSAAENRGFAGGNNLGVQTALSAQPMPKYVWLLNPDTLIRPGAAAALAGFMDANPRVGIAGSRLLNGQGEIQRSAHRFHTPLSELEGMLRCGPVSRALARYCVSPKVPAEPAECDWVSGASFMIRTEMLQQIGLLDEGYFLYFEEVDYCRRAKEAGWEVWYVPQSEVVHLEGASTGIQEPRKRRAPYWFNSRRRYFRKHFGTMGWMAADVLWALGWAGYRARRLLRLGRGDDTDPIRFAWDLLGGDVRALLISE